MLMVMLLLKINNNYIIYSNNITYEKNSEKIFSRGKTKSEINSRFILDSIDVVFLEIKDIKFKQRYFDIR